VAVLYAGLEANAESQAEVKAFMEGLAALGWSNGRNVQIDIRWSDVEVNELRRLARELLNLRPDVIFAVSTPSVNAIRRENPDIPIVFSAVTDPVAQGLVETMARPGRNVTGFMVFEPEIGTKWIQVLKEIAPETKRLGVIFNPDTAPYYKLYMSSIEAAGTFFAVKAIEVPVHSRSDIEAAISMLAREPAGAVIAMPDNFVGPHEDLIIALAANYRMPGVYPFRHWATAGGLISYGVDLIDMNRRAASYVDRILKGEKPGNLPIQLPTKFVMVVNLKTAKALGLTIPETLLATADEVIQSGETAGIEATPSPSHPGPRGPLTRPNVSGRSPAACGRVQRLARRYRPIAADISGRSTAACAAWDDPSATRVWRASVRFGVGEPRRWGGP
jgi:putative tryptophan/tyrosine transport system substrate-binding protein